MAKRVKVRQNKDFEGKRHRSTQEELCRKYTNERSKLYKERKKVRSIIESGKVSGKKLDVSTKRLLTLNYKIEGYTSKLFKCGKRYAKLKSKKRKLVNRRNYLVRILKNAEVGSKEQKQNLKELMSIVSKLNDLDYAMKLRIIGTEKGELKVGMPEVPQVVNVETLGFWELSNLISDSILAGNFTTIVLDGKSFDLATQNFLLQEKAREIIREMTKARESGKKIGTPMVIIETNYTTGEITITSGL